MLIAIIKFSIRHKIMVLACLVGTIIFSVYTIQRAALDAVPDISDTQIIIYAKWDRSPELLENSVARPIIRTLLGLAGIKHIRSTSHLGYTFIYIVLDSPYQRSQMRGIILDKINSIRSKLPLEADITLGPDANSMGWIYQYALVDQSGVLDLRELRLLNERLIKPKLETIPGIAEVATVAGLERQIALKVFPMLLAKTGISLRQLVNALKNAFQQVGGRTIELTNRDYHLRGVINNSDIDKLELLVIGRDSNDQAVLLKDIGYLQVDYDIRRGIADLDGKGEVVGAIVVMQQQQNVLAVSNYIEGKLASIKAVLPDGVNIITTYNRSSLIWTTLKNFSIALGYELFIVVLVIVWALRNGRAAVAPVIIILTGSLYTLLALAFVGQTINLLSLAGLSIAIGEMADATIVIIENCNIKLSQKGVLTRQKKIEYIIHSSAKLMRPLLFSMVIIIASFLPLFFLDVREGRLFNPLILSKTFAMGFSTLLTLFLLPVIIIWVFNGKTPSKRATKENRLVQGYRAMLKKAIQYRYIFVGLSLISITLAIFAMNHFETDYMPKMEEGSILYMPTTLPGIPMREAGWILQKMDKKLSNFVEVQRVFGKLGRADTSTDPAPLTMIETTIILKPKSEWRKGMTKKKLIAEMNAALQITGYVNSWTQPIAGRVIMQNTGIQTPVGIKIKGSDILIIEKIAKQVEKLLMKHSSLASVIAERIADGYYINVQNDLQRLAEYGITVDEVMLTIRYAIGGENLVYIREHDNTSTPLSVQYAPEYIDTLEKVRNTLVITETGQAIPIHKLAEIKIKKMPEMIRSDNGELTGYIYIDPVNTTAADYVTGAKKYLIDTLSLPIGYSLEWTGTYRYVEESRSRLKWIIPLTLIMMFGLLILTFKSISISAMALLSAPFALIGGVILQWAQGYTMTTAVIIGYIAVFAIAMQTGIIMIEFIREALKRESQALKARSKTYVEVVIDGSVARLRPKLMTVATTVLGLAPILLATGSGLDITKPIAAPSVGGMLSSTIYVLFLIPCLFAIGEDLRQSKTKERSRNNSYN